MPVLFSGFSRPLDRRGLRPGRWFLAGGGASSLCFLTAAGEGPAALAAAFHLRRLDQLEVRALRLAELPAPLQTLEDDLVFLPGDGEEPRLAPGGRRAPAPGSLLRLADGEMGLAFPDGAAVRPVSLSSGETAPGFDLVFERWTLVLRRNGREGLVGRFRPEPRLSVGEARA